MRRGSSVPPLPIFSLPNEPESLEKGKRITMRHTMPPTLNCFNKKTTPVHRIHPQLVHKAHFMQSTWGEIESSDTSEESSTRESSEYASLKIYPSHSSMGVSKTGSTYSKSKGSSQCASCHHASVEEGQCKGTKIPRGKVNPTLPQTPPQEDLMGQLHIVTTAGSMDNMNSQDRSPPFFSEEAKGEGPAIQEREARPSSPHTP